MCSTSEDKLKRCRQDETAVREYKNVSFEKNKNENGNNNVKQSERKMNIESTEMGWTV